MQQFISLPLFVSHNGRFSLYLLLVLSLTILVACTTSDTEADPFDPLSVLLTPRPTATPTVELPTPDVAATAWAAATRIAQPTATPVVGLGQGRTNPLPAGEFVDTGTWQLLLLDRIQGEDAWDILRRTNRSNDPPPPGYEYLLIQVWLKNSSAEEAGAWIDITGDKHRIYRAHQAGVVRPEPRLDMDGLAVGEERVGWLAFLVTQAEGNLLLRLESRWVSGSDAVPTYVALDEGAVVRRSATLDSITATDWGKTAVDPVLPGQIATSLLWQMQVRDVVLGEAAFDMLIETNRFNDPPQPGMQYGLVYMWLQYIGPGETAVILSPTQFDVIDQEGNSYRSPYVVLPAPELRAELYPGGELEGWLAIQIPETETNPLLLVEMRHDNPRYLSLTGSGR